MSLSVSKKAAGPLRTGFLHRASPFVFWGSFALVLAWAAFQRFSLPLVPAFDPDIQGYLNPALSALAGGPFIQVEQRAFLYPAILLAVLKGTGSLAGIVVFQHLTSLACGVVWMVIWRAWVAFLPKSGVRLYVVPWIGLAGAALYLWGADTIFFGIQVRPEAVFPLFASLQVACQMLYIHARWPVQQAAEGRWGLYLSGAGALLFAAMAYNLKPSWGFAVLTSPLLLVAGIIFRRGALPVGATVWPLILGALLAGLFVVGLPRVLGWVPERESSDFLPKHLFSVHADIILDNLQGQVAGGRAAPDDLRFAGSLARSVEESRAALGPYRLLGHNPDYLMYGSSALAELPGVTSGQERRSYYLKTYLDSLRHFPARYLRKWLIQMRAAVMPDPKFLFRPIGKLKKLYQISSACRTPPPPSLPPDLARSLESAAAETQRLAEALPEKTRTGPGWMRAVAQAGSVLLGLSLGVCLVSLAVLPFCPAGHERAVLSSALIAGSFLLSSLTVALVHSFDIDRYNSLQSWIAWLVISCGAALAFSLSGPHFHRAAGAIHHRLRD